MENELNVHKLLMEISRKEKKEVWTLYGELYKKIKKQFPELNFGIAKNKITDIKEQGYYDNLINIIKEDYVDYYTDYISRSDETKYTDEQKIKIMERELNLIGGIEESNEINNDIKKFVVRSLLKVPNYFWKIPAASSGKYHPLFTLECGGLVKHTKALVKILFDLYQVEIFEFNERKRGILVASGILHDCAKLGFNGSQYTIPKHPIEIVDFLKENIELEDFPEEDFNKMCDCISSHMGKWNTSGRGKNPKEILPKPKSKMQVVLHIADLMASRKYISMDFSKDFDV